VQCIVFFKTILIRAILFAWDLLFSSSNITLQLPCPLLSGWPKFLEKGLYDRCFHGTFSCVCGKLGSPCARNLNICKRRSIMKKISIWICTEASAIWWISGMYRNCYTPNLCQTQQFACEKLNGSRRCLIQGSNIKVHVHLKNAFPGGIGKSSIPDLLHRYEIPTEILSKMNLFRPKPATPPPGTAVTV